MLKKSFLQFCIYFIFPLNQRILTVKVQVIYFVNKCEAMFFTERLKIFKCTWIKCLLETNLASTVKPNIVTKLNIPFFALS